MITGLLVIIALVLLFLAVKTYLIGSQMTLDQLKSLTQAIEEFAKSERIIVKQTSKNCLFFEKSFVKAVKIRSIYLSAQSKAFVANWNNGRASHFIADNQEELQQLMAFATLLQSVIMSADENSKQTGDEQ